MKTFRRKLEISDMVEKFGRKETEAEKERYKEQKYKDWWPTISELTSDRAKNKKGDYIGNPISSQCPTKQIYLFTSMLEKWFSCDHRQMYSGIRCICLGLFLWSQFVPNRVNMSGQIWFDPISFQSGFLSFQMSSQILGRERESEFQ